MAATTSIEWTDRTWNPVAGCNRISSGCKNCYAEKMGKRLRAMALADQKDGKNPGRKAAYIDAINPAGGWSGNLIMVPDALRDPLKWKKPQRIFVNSMSDLFHDAVPFEFIDQVFAVMYAAQWHTFQVLTKRADRMRDYFASDPLPRIAAMAFRQWTDWNQEKASQGILTNSDIADDLSGMWPLPNVWLGVSIENQAMADKRIPDLLATTAAVRFLSCEPLLGPIDLGLSNATCQCCERLPSRWIKLERGVRGDVPGSTTEAGPGIYRAESNRHGALSVRATNGEMLGVLPREMEVLGSIDWVIVGGESGHDARPMHPDWARSLRYQCQAAKVPFFYKQWGEWKPLHGDGWPHGDEDDEGKFPWTWITTDGELRQSGSRPDAVMQKVGKNRAGRLLDGRTWGMFPGDQDDIAW